MRKMPSEAPWAPGCLLGASWVPPGCLLGASWVPPGCFLGASCRIQECLFRKYKNPFWIPWENKSLWNEFITNEKCKSGFTPKTSIRLVDTIVNRLFYQKPDIEYSSVRSFCPWRFDPIIKEEAGFDKKLANIRGWFYPKSRIFRFWVKRSVHFQKWNDE